MCDDDIKKINNIKSLFRHNPPVPLRESVKKNTQSLKMFPRRNVPKQQAQLSLL